MNLTFFIIASILLFCNISKIVGQEPDSDSTTEALEDNQTKGKDSKTVSSVTTEKPAQSKTNIPPIKDYSTNEDPELKGSNCSKTCHKNLVKKYQNKCVSIKYKNAEKAKTRDECLEMCKKHPICTSATFVKPRNPTTFDLKTLYDRVIDSENWVSLKKPGSLFKYYAQLSRELMAKAQTENDKSKEPNFSDDYGSDRYSLVNISALVTTTDVIGSCFIYDDKLPEDAKLECSPSHLTFIYDEISCIEDPNCVRPRKPCLRGRCGPKWHKLKSWKYNYIHIPNTCMGKYYFGHLAADSLKSCLEFCLQSPECLSIDFGNMGSCLLNYVTRNETQLTLGCDSKNNEIWDYYEILNDSECLYEKPRPSPHEDTCSNIPGICKNGGNCEPIQLIDPPQSFSYGCHCPCNWCGKHCDKLNMKTFRNGCLNSSVLVWSVAENSGDCIDMCLDEIHCKSVSYSATSGTCALHWADHETDPIVASPHCPTYRTDIVEKEWTFYEIICNTTACHSSVEVIEAKELKGCASNPCLNGGECADIFQKGKVIGFHCLCKCGYCGDRCEAHNYVLTPNACIWGAHISNSPADYHRKAIPLNACLSVCASKFPLCRSVDYSNKGECLLNDKDSDIAIVTKKCNNYLRQIWSLYDLSCVCNNRPIIY